MVGGSKTKLKKIWRHSKDVSRSQIVLTMALPFDQLALNEQVCYFEEISPTSFSTTASDINFLCSFEPGQDILDILVLPKPVLFVCV